MATAVRGRTVWLPPVVLFAFVVLLGSLAFAIANLDRGEEALPEVPTIGGGAGGASTSPFGPSGEQLQIVLRVVIAVIFIMAIVAAIVARLTKQKVLSIWELLGYAFGIGVVGGLVIFWPVVVAGLQSLTIPGGQTQPPSPGGAAGGGPIPLSQAFPIAFFLFAVIGFAVYLFALSFRIFPQIVALVTEKPAGRARREAANVVRRTLLDLEAGTDFRTAVMACYQRMCSLIATRGVSRQEALTAREIEVLALAELGLSRAGVDDLTGLFEEARYSVHDIGPSQRDRAVECLTAIRRELEG
ncbi:MAG: DUF4129 domain-containing protein [Methanobacteriota archaeon]|nr:MAG: DUF4129 domain-containing protein [Euryarchaeota archaeon]